MKTGADKLTEAKDKYLLEAKSTIERTMALKDIELMLAVVENAYLAGAIAEQGIVIEKLKI